jgi:molecular chaperone GrpE
MTDERTSEDAPISEPHPKQQGESPDTPQDAVTAELADLQARLEEALKGVEVCRDQLLRKAAEFENYKRRNEADFASLVRTSNENLLSALLPVVDDFLRSLKAGKELRDYEAFYRGIELIASKLTRTLENEGLQPFESVGKPFDVHYHDALLQVPREDLPHHTVIEEVERGYMLDDRVLRHAKVIVSSAPEKPAEASDQQPEAEKN